ncbi:molybdenum cofactor guanylyltransferase MobA [Frigidibacter sp. MR17.14]|uniref:molybdenum cofactor guanylyltransferase MobA n=1 Tax=Frigidibacter sp. MR17.14 TaxID=3126509 RepID=UPI00301304CE
MSDGFVASDGGKRAAPCPATTAVLILAGGQSRRMGRDKALVPLGGEPLLARLHAQAAALLPGAPVAVSWNGGALPAELGATVLADRVPGQAGPLAGLQAGLDWADGIGRDWLLSLPVDTPFLPADLFQRLAERAGPTPAIARAGDRLHPAVGLWPCGLGAPLAAALAAGERRVAGWALSADAQVVDFPEAAAFANLNTPEDLAAAERSLAEGAR